MGIDDGGPGVVGGAHHDCGAVQWVWGIESETEMMRACTREFWLAGGLGDHQAACKSPILGARGDHGIDLADGHDLVKVESVDRSLYIHIPGRGQVLVCGQIARDVSSRRGRVRGLDLVLFVVEQLRLPFQH